MPMLPPWREDRGINPDQLAVQVKQRAAGVAAVNRGIGLNKVLKPFQIKPAASQR